MSEAIPERVREERSVPPEPSPVATSNTELKAFSFEVVTIDERGQEVKREKGQAQYFTEDLGKGVELELVYIPGGTFRMGSPEGSGSNGEKPPHEVTVQPFLMGKCPVTQEQWRTMASLPRVKQELELNPSYFKGDKRPVERVAWEDAQEFCARLSKRTTRQYRLPTEAEWEYACKAGTSTPFHLGKTITGELANYRANKTYASEPPGEERGETTPVGTFSPNAFGLYDLHGQVWEWCEDDWHANYEDAPTDGSSWSPGGGNIKVIRGGSWDSYPVSCRSVARNNPSPILRCPQLGFRVVCVVPRGISCKQGC